MNKHHLHKLLTRYRSGDCTEQEKRLVEQWFALIDGDESHHAYQQNQQTEERIWMAIQGRYQPASSWKGKLLPLLTWRWAAAVLLLITAWGTYQFDHNRRAGKQALEGNITQGLVVKTNDTALPLLLALEDGTEVSLLPNSSIEYPAKFQPGKREVFLKGKAFFKVFRDPQKPFFVYTGPIATQVLGTSFWIDSSDDSSAVEVSVVTGKVSVFQRIIGKNNVGENVGNGVVLIPNQRVTYSGKDQSFVTRLVEEPVMLDSYSGAFVFNDAPLDKVVDLLEKAYGIDIVLENDKLKNCLFTADLNKQPMFTKLDLISSSVNARYKIRGTKILLSGQGCPSN
ncbi:FecR family protein [Dyadobacter sp. CY347]|uniref:FecR family protein n=1 Tax=Dyadobacter sp. CY347 TaxID=2909336 RepID=UPI001F1D810E|nr:FecR family protein [Dyadobacter sp. CY347]MCF2489259.1 FecR domain-containing protein [Dyadobacter sp. CY347]